MDNDYEGLNVNLILTSYISGIWIKASYYYGRSFIKLATAALVAILCMLALITWIILWETFYPIRGLVTLLCNVQCYNAILSLAMKCVAQSNCCNCFVRDFLCSFRDILYKCLNTLFIMLAWYNIFTFDPMWLPYVWNYNLFLHHIVNYRFLPHFKCYTSLNSLIIWHLEMYFCTLHINENWSVAISYYVVITTCDL